MRYVETAHIYFMRDIKSVQIVHSLTQGRRLRIEDKGGIHCEMAQSILHTTKVIVVDDKM